MLILFCKPSYRKQWITCIKRVSQWFLFNTKWKFFQIYHGKNRFWWDNDVCFVPDQHTELDFYSASSLKNSLQIDMSFHSDTFLWFRPNQSLLLLQTYAGLSDLTGKNQAVGDDVFGILVRKSGKILLSTLVMKQFSLCRFVKQCL